MYKKINIKRCIAIAIACLSLSVVYIYHVTNSLNPYQLTGKQFLAFYGLLTFTSLAIALVWLVSLKISNNVNKQEGQVSTIPQPLHCMAFVLLIGFCRLLQGISNQKPVSYLVIFLLMNSFIYLLLRLLKKRI